MKSLHPSQGVTLLRPVAAGASGDQQAGHEKLPAGALKGVGACTAKQPLPPQHGADQQPTPVQAGHVML